MPLLLDCSSVQQVKVPSTSIMRIDNIFVDNRMDVLQFTLVKKKLSDHFSIIADIEMAEK